MKNNKIITLLIFISCSIFSFGAEENNKNIFPIFGEEAIAKGYKLPKPMGINFVYVDMEQNVDINKIELSKLYFNKINLDPILKKDFNFSIDAKKAKSINKNKIVRADLWIFPFLNVYGIFGQTKGYSKTKVDINIAAKNPFFNFLLKPILSKVPKDMDFTLNYDGITYGMGTTLVTGYRNFFFIGDLNYTKTSLDIIEGEISALVLSPKIGYNFTFYKLPISIWFGGMYQDITQTLKGNIADVIKLPVPITGKFEIDESSSSNWNKIIGLRTEFYETIETTLEFGYGDRKSMTLALGYRF